jgi:hypothetical protein
VFRISCADATLPGQASGATLNAPNAPRLMVWDEAQSRWCEILVSSVQDLTGGLYDVVCTGTLPAMTLAVGQWVSPQTKYAPYIASSLEEYFDELGPGELFDIAVDARGGRCTRFPSMSEERPSKVTAILSTRVTEALGGVEANLASVGPTAPSYPADPQNGPHMLTLGKVAVYEL